MVLQRNLDQVVSADQLPTEAELASKSPYKEKSKESQPLKPSKKADGRALQRLKRDREGLLKQIENLRERERVRRESIPRLLVDDDQISLVYQGLVAGKTATRTVPLTRSSSVANLKEVLTPLVHVLNAALHSRQLEEERLRLTVLNDSGKETEIMPYDEGNNPIFKATSLSKARIAYARLFENDSIRKSLDQLGKTVKAYMDECREQHLIEVSRISSVSNFDETRGTWINTDPKPANTRPKVKANEESGDLDDSELGRSNTPR